MFAVFRLQISLKKLGYEKRKHLLSVCLNFHALFGFFGGRWKGIAESPENFHWKISLGTFFLRAVFRVGVFTRSRMITRYSKGT